MCQSYKIKFCFLWQAWHLEFPTLFAGSHKTPLSLFFFSQTVCLHTCLFTVVCPLWRSGVSAMQGARQSALYFTCHCLTPFLSLLLQASVTMCLDDEVHYSETAPPLLFSPFLIIIYKHGLNLK